MGRRPWTRSGSDIPGRAKGQEYDRQRGEQVGANLYTTKPFDPDELLARAREVLAGV